MALENNQSYLPIICFSIKIYHSSPIARMCEKHHGWSIAPDNVRAHGTACLNHQVEQSIYNISSSKKWERPWFARKEKQLTINHMYNRSCNWILL